MPPQKRSLNKLSQRVAAVPGQMTLSSLIMAKKPKRDVRPPFHFEALSMEYDQWVTDKWGNLPSKSSERNARKKPEKDRGKGNQSARNAKNFGPLRGRKK